tara:strand:+ start:15478 stop:16203 length:726 start_codon:yes stop_codon:yes gene_type:complete
MRPALSDDRSQGMEDTLVRQKQLAQRRNKLLDAAESLIRMSHSSEFTMLALAELAGVSPTTPYNLFSSKAGLLYALMNRSMDGVSDLGEIAAAQKDPFDRALAYADAVAAFFSSDPSFYRVLYRFLLGVSDPLHRPAFMDRGLAYWRDSIGGLEAAGLIPAELSADQLALELEIHFVGVLDLWIQGELSESAFRAQTVHGVILLLLGIADEPSRPKLLKKLRSTSSKLTRSFSFQKAGRRR